MFDQQTGEEQRVCGGTQFLELSSVYNTEVGRSHGKVYNLLGCPLYIVGGGRCFNYRLCDDVADDTSCHGTSTPL